MTDLVTMDYYGAEQRLLSSVGRRSVALAKMDKRETPGRRGVLGPGQMAWCKAHLRGFVDEDGKTRLEKYNEAQKALEARKVELGLKQEYESRCGTLERGGERAGRASDAAQRGDTGPVDEARLTCATGSREIGATNTRRHATPTRINN